MACVTVEVHTQAHRRAGGRLALRYRGQLLAHQVPMMHEHLRLKKMADDKALNQRIDAPSKEQQG